MAHIQEKALCKIDEICEKYAEEKHASDDDSQ